MTKQLVEIYGDSEKPYKLEARVFYNSVDGYSVDYYIAENLAKSVSYPNKSKYFVENVIKSWFKETEVLNG